MQKSKKTGPKILDTKLSVTWLEDIIGDEDGSPNFYVRITPRIKSKGTIMNEEALKAVIINKVVSEGQKEKLKIKKGS